MLWAFLAIAALVTITPGRATALVLRSAARGGRDTGLATNAGNSVGTWLERATGTLLAALVLRVALDARP